MCREVLAKECHGFNREIHCAEKTALDCLAKAHKEIFHFMYVHSLLMHSEEMV